MNKKIITLFILLIFTVFSACAYSYVFGGSNFGLTDYPSFSVWAPSKPYTSYTSTVSKYDYESYKSDVENYVNMAKAYVENANNDIERIKNAQEEVIKKANAVVDEYNSWVRSVTVSSSY